jgi:hypothetical protein
VPVVLVTDAAKHHRIVMFARRLLRALKHRSEVGVTDVGNREDYQARAAHPKRACGVVRAVSHFAGGMQDRLLGRFPYATSSFPR